MLESLYQKVKESNLKMDWVEPAWLKAQEVPDFDVKSFGDKGPSLLLLHGLLGAMTNWDGAIPYFKEYAKTLAFHFPILSSHRSDVGIKSLALYTEFYIRQNSLKPLVLCGNSLGGHVALRLALNSPDLIDALVLTGSSGLYEHTVDTLPIRPSREFIKSQMQRVFYSEEFITEEAIEEVYSTLRNRKHQLNIIHSARSAKKDFLLDRLKEIKIPVLLVWGKDDLVTTLNVAETFQENLSNSKLVVFDKCGHAPMIEHPDKFSNAVKKFLVEEGLYQ